MTGEGNPPPKEPLDAPASERLDSWKEIAAFLRRDVRTVQRWEKQFGLPVHRHAQSRLRTTYAFRSELETWWQTQQQVVDESPQTGGPEPAPEIRLKGRRRIIVISAAVLLAAALTAGFIGIWRSTHARLPSTGKSPITVLVAHFDDQASDAELASVLEERIGRTLDAHPDIETVELARVARVLRLMRRDPSTRLTDAAAREVAIRDGRVTFTIAGRLGRIDARLFLELDAIHPTDGDLRVSVRWEGENATQLLTEISNSTNQLANQLVVAGLEPRNAVAPLEQVTSASLPAVRLYTTALDAARRRQWGAAEMLARRAAEADDRFACAYALAGWCIRQQRRPISESRQMLQQAATLANETSDRETYFIAGAHRTVEEDFLGAVSAFEALFRLQPENREALDLLIEAYTRAGRWKDAVELSVTRAERAPQDFYANVRAVHALNMTRRSDARVPAFVERARQLASSQEARDRPAWSAWLSIYPVFENWLARDRKAALSGLSALDRSLSDRFGRERDAYATAIGFAYLAFGQVEDAERVFWTAAAPVRQLNLASLAVTKGDETRARDWLSQITDHSAARPALFARLGFDHEAERGLETSPLGEHTDGVAAVTRGLIALNRGDIDAARGELRRGADLLRFSGEPEYFLAADALARIARERGDPNRSIRWLSQAAAARAQTYGTSHWTAGYWIALSTDLMGRYQRAGRLSEAERLNTELRVALDADGQAKNPSAGR